MEQGEAPAEQKSLAKRSDRYLMLLNALIAALTVIALMARKGRGRRKFRRYIRGNIVDEQSLGTLGASTGIKNAFEGQATETTWISSVRLSCSLGNFTAAAGQGPIEVYLAHSDYTLAEVEEYIEAGQTASWNVGDLRTQEQMGRGRRIKRVGVFETAGNHQASDSIQLFKQSGGFKTVKLGFMLETGQTVAVIYYNQGEVALATTDPVVQINGHANLWPV